MLRGSFKSVTTLMELAPFREMESPTMVTKVTNVVSLVHRQQGQRRYWIGKLCNRLLH